jgi:hypothetical protein
MKVPNTDGMIPAGWGGEDADAATTAVRGGETTLSQVALRLGVSLDDLQNANQQIKADKLSPGMEIRIPGAAGGEPKPVVAAADDAADAAAAASAASKRMESSLDGAVKRALFSAPGGFPRAALPADSRPYGGGGITHEPPVADPIHGEGFSSQIKKETTDQLRAAYDDPRFKQLDPADQDAFLHTLAANPPLTPEKVSNALDLLGAAKQLSPADHKLVTAGFKAAHGDSKYSANLKQLITDPKFQSLGAPEKTAVLSQTKNYPDAGSVKNIDRMLQKDWFTGQNLADKQRSLKTIARLSQDRPHTDRGIINRTLDKLLGDKSPYNLEWKNYAIGDDTYGQGGHNTLFVNRGMIPAGNDKMVENEDTDHLTLNSMPHEINHLLNNDLVADTFHYFEGEYRAWYVGFQAQNGRVPTNQEAMEQRIRWQFDPDSSYGQHAAEAMKKPAEAQQFYDFLASVTGAKVDASNWRTVLNSDPVSWPNLSESPAPVPSGNIDNH